MRFSFTFAFVRREFWVMHVVRHGIFKNGVFCASNDVCRLVFFGALDRLGNYEEQGCEKRHVA